MSSWSMMWVDNLTLYPSQKGWTTVLIVIKLQVEKLGLYLEQCTMWPVDLGSWPHHTDHTHKISPGTNTCSMDRSSKYIEGTDSPDVISCWIIGNNIKNYCEHNHKFDTKIYAHLEANPIQDSKQNDGDGHVPLVYDGCSI